jgi:hypothetical protein
LIFLPAAGVPAATGVLVDVLDFPQPAKNTNTDNNNNAVIPNLFLIA